MTDRMWCLKKCDLFSKLTADQVQRIEAKSRYRSYSAGKPIYLPSEKADSVFLLTSGLVKVCNLTPDGKESILAFVEQGELFGEIAIFSRETRDEYVEAVDSSTVVMIPAEEMELLMNENPDVAMAFTKIIGLRRQCIERRLKNLLFKSNRERLVHLLLDLALQFGWAAEDGIRLRVRLSHQDLANLIGSTRESVTVILSQLKSEGTIKNGRRKIVLTNADRLARSVHRQPPRSASQAPRFVPAFATG
jgi:CRP/FNR family cyclic AMP-dependent transcriptional regulator